MMGSLAFESMLRFSYLNQGSPEQHLFAHAL